MSKRAPSAETVLEIGLAAAVIGLLVGIAFLLSGWATGGIRRGRNGRRGAPAAGEVPTSRHQHIGSVSAR